MGTGRENSHFISNIHFPCRRFNLPVTCRNPSKSFYLRKSARRHSCGRFAFASERFLGELFGIYRLDGDILDGDGVRLSCDNGLLIDDALQTGRNLRLREPVLRVREAERQFLARRELERHAQLFLRRHPFSLLSLLLIARISPRERPYPCVRSGSVRASEDRQTRCRPQARPHL